MDSTRANSLHSQEKAANSGEDDRSSRAISDSLPDSFVSDEEPGTKNSKSDDNDDDDEPYSDSDYGARLDLHFPQIREGFNNNTSMVRQPQPYTIHLLDNTNCILDKDQYGRKIRAQLTLDPDDYQPHVKIEVTRELSREPSKSTSEEREQCDSIAAKYTFTSMDRYLNHPKDENLGFQIVHLNDPSTAQFASMPPETSERVIAITDSRFRQAFLCMIIHREEGILDMRTFWDVPAWAREVAPVLTQRNTQFIIEGPSNTDEAVATFVEFLAKKNYGYLEFHRGKYKDLLSYTDENMNPPGSVSLKPVDYSFQPVCQFQDPHELATLQFTTASELLRLHCAAITQFDEGNHNLILLPAPAPVVSNLPETYYGYIRTSQDSAEGTKAYIPRFGDTMEISFDPAEIWTTAEEFRTSLIWRAQICKPLDIKVPKGWYPCFLERPLNRKTGRPGTFEPEITGTQSMHKKALEIVLSEAAGQPIRAKLDTREHPLLNVKRAIEKMMNDTDTTPFTAWNTRIKKLLLGTRLDQLEEADLFDCISQDLGPDMFKLLKLDMNQAAALEMARKSRGGLAIIQGPPGTGKSHVVKQVVLLNLLRGQSQPQVVICCPNNLTADALAEDIDTDYQARHEGTSRQKYIIRLFSEAADRQYRDLQRAQSLQTDLDSKHLRRSTSRDDFKNKLARLPEIQQAIVSAILETKERPTEGVNDARFTLPKLSAGYYMLESVGLIPGQPSWPKFEKKHHQFASWHRMWSRGDFFDHNSLARYAKCSNELYKDILSNASVIVSTTAGIAAPRCLEAIESTTTTLIFEENTREAELHLMPIFAARFQRDPKILVIGDQCQLPPQAPVAVTDLVLVRQVEVSFMARLLAVAHRYAMLITNYRMAPEIAEPINRLIYDGRLSNHRSVEADCRPFQMQFRKYVQERFQIVDCNAIWLDTASGGKNITEVNSTSRSRKNEFHVGLTLNIIDDLLNMNAGGGDSPRVTIITIYEDQKSLYLQARSQMQVLNAVHVENLDSVNTDGAQGLEWDFVVVDLSLSEQAGFAADSRRLNVAFSRARDGLIIVGNAKQISDMKGAQILKNFKNYYVKNKKSYTVKSDEWFVSKYFSPTESKRLPQRPSRR